MTWRPGCRWSCVFVDRQLTFHFINQLVPGECAKVMTSFMQVVQRHTQVADFEARRDHAVFTPQAVAELLTRNLRIDRVGCPGPGTAGRSAIASGRTPALTGLCCVRVGLFAGACMAQTRLRVCAAAAAALLTVHGVEQVAKGLRRMGLTYQTAFAYVAHNLRVRQWQVACCCARS